MTADAKYEEKIKIRRADCGVHDMSVLALFQTMQYMTEAGTNALGIGLNYCEPQKLTWMARRYHVEINRMPRGDETTAWSTWTSALNGASGIREIEVFDADRQKLLGAASEWIMVNVADPARPKLSRLDAHVKSSPVCPDPSVTMGFSHVLSLKGLSDMFWDDTSVQVNSVPVHYTDCDFHYQANNARYPHWAVSALDPRFLMEFGPKMISVDLKTPSKMGEELLVQTQKAPAEKTIAAHITRHRIMKKAAPADAPFLKAAVSIQFAQRERGAAL